MRRSLVRRLGLLGVGGGDARGQRAHLGEQRFVAAVLRREFVAERLQRRFKVRDTDLEFGEAVGGR